MHYIDRWIFSQIVATTALFALFALIGIPQHIWLDMLHMWFVVMAVNNLRLTLSRNRRVIVPTISGEGET